MERFAGAVAERGFQRAVLTGRIACGVARGMPVLGLPLTDFSAFRNAVQP